MTLAGPLLEKLADWQPTGTGRHASAYAFPERGWAVSLTADRADEIGMLLWEMGVAPTAPAPVPDLAGRAGLIAGRVTGLLEQLSVYEVAADVAILRSRKPSQRGDQVAYYEVLVRTDGSASARRYQSSFGPGARREQVAFALTREAAAKLAADLAA